MRYAIAFSTLTGCSAVHSLDCPVPIRLGTRRCVVETLDAPSAADAAAQYATLEDLARRGLPLPVVCDCAK